MKVIPQYKVISPYNYGMIIQVEILKKTMGWSNNTNNRHTDGQIDNKKDR